MMPCSLGAQSIISSTRLLGRCFLGSQRQQTRFKPSIVAVLRRYGGEDMPLSGGWKPILCPFHDDKTKSASVHPDWNAFHCFTCGVSGDSWKLLMEQEGITFIEALRLAETELGYESETLSRPVGKRRYRPSWEKLPRLPRSWHTGDRTEVRAWVCS
jgi:hypothetical protein